MIQAFRLNTPLLRLTTGTLVSKKLWEKTSHLVYSRMSLASESQQKLTESSLLGKRRMPASLGTHNGTFHADEALGCFLIKLTEKFKEAEIVRTRDSKVHLQLNSTSSR